MANSCRAFSTGGFVYGHRRDPMHHAGHLDRPDRDLSDRRGPDRRSGHDLVCRGRARRAHRRHVPRAAVAAARVVFRRVDRGLRRDAPAGEKYINSRTQPTNADMLIGQECLVTEDIDNLAGRGAVSVGGKVWTARAQTDAPSPPGLRPSCCASRASSSSSHPPA